MTNSTIINLVERGLPLHSMASILDANSSEVYHKLKELDVYDKWKKSYNITEQIKECIEKGMSSQQISSKLGIPQPIIVNKMNSIHHEKNNDKDRNALIYRLWAEGKNKTAIALQLKMSVKELNSIWHTVGGLLKAEESFKSSVERWMTTLTEDEIISKHKVSKRRLKDVINQLKESEMKIFNSGNGDAYTSEEDEFINTHYNSGRSTTILLEHFPNRTGSSVYGRWWYLKNKEGKDSSKDRTGWTKEETTKIYQLIKEGKSRQQVADEIGRSYYSVSKKLLRDRSKGLTPKLILAVDNYNKFINNVGLQSGETTEQVVSLLKEDSSNIKSSFKTTVDSERLKEGMTKLWNREQTENVKELEEYINNDTYSYLIDKIIASGRKFIVVLD